MAYMDAKPSQDQQSQVYDPTLAIEQVNKPSIKKKQVEKKKSQSPNKSIDRLKSVWRAENNVVLRSSVSTAFDINESHGI